MKAKTKRERPWCVGLRCTHCGEPVSWTKGEGSFSYGLQEGKPLAVHRTCKDLREAS